MVEEVIGKVYGRLTVLSKAKSVNKRRMVLVRCSCEKATEKILALNRLKIGDTASCGCIRSENLTSRSLTHGLTKHRLYQTWANMLYRCENPKARNYADYGGRGIIVCDRWKDVSKFIEDMFPTHLEGLTLDRKDNSKGYSPENCRWISPHGQNRNMRSNVNVTLDGKTKCLKDWCGELGMNYGTVKQRIKTGKTVEEALELQAVKPKVYARSAQTLRQRQLWLQ
jgi:hypothetical protein